MARARANLAEQNAALARVRAGGRRSEIDAQRARIASLTAQEEISRRDASRTDRLVPSGAGAEAVAERNRFATTRASAERALAEADLATLSTPAPRMSPSPRPASPAPRPRSTKPWPMPPSRACSPPSAAPSCASMPARVTR